MYQAIIFDLDGLLIDSETLYRKVTIQMAAGYGKQMPDGLWVKQMGRSPLESLTIFRAELGITSHTAQELVDIRNQMMIEAFRDDLQVMPGALELIQAFHGEIKMAIATGSPRILMDIALEKLGISDYFEYKLPSDEITAGKPDPEIYLKVVQALGCLPEECIVLEDSSNGALSGHRAGCCVIAVPSEYTRDQDFTFAGHVVGNLGEAAEVIRRLVSYLRRL